MHQRILAVAMAAAVAFLAACDIEDLGDLGGSERYTEDFQHSFPLRPGGRISVENFNGSIEISSWNENSVEIRGTKYARSIELRDAIKIDISAQPEAIQVRTIRPSGMRGNMGARYYIRVPRKTELERITSTNGSIRVADVEGEARLRTTNGAVRVEDLLGRLDVQTSNGSVEVTGQEGGAVLRTSNGRIRAEDVRGGLNASTSNGSITARLADADPGRTIRIGTSNGPVDLSLDGTAGDVRVSTTNGGITVRLPEQINARVVAATTNSSIKSDFEVIAKGELSKKRIEGLIGSGDGPTIDLSTTNGSIRLMRQ